MEKDKTSLYNIDEIQDALALTTLDEVYDALKEKEYEPISQIVGYLVSGDSGYITNHKGARNKILSLDRTNILEALVREYLEK